MYLDIPFDLQDPPYGMLQSFLEHPDGTIRFENTRFWALTFEIPTRNAHHDEAGFWDRGVGHPL